MMKLTPRQNDALRETMNIAVGRAARSLGALINKTIQLEVPEVYVVSPNAAKALLRQVTRTEEAVTISQDFSGSITGRVGMYFPLESADTLLKLLWGRSSENLSSFSLEEQSVLEEIANILLNGAISALADLLKEMIQLSLPTVILTNEGSSYEDWIAKDLDPTKSALVIVVANMVVEDEIIQGLIVLSLAIVQVKQLIQKLV